MPKFRKKPVVIEAMQWTGSNELDLLQGLPGLKGVYEAKWEGELVIATLEGAMTARPGDWIIKGVKNEFYPCKPEIFAATYEPAE